MDARLKVARTAFKTISRGPKKAHRTYATSHNTTMLRIIRVEQAWSITPDMYSLVQSITPKYLILYVFVGWEQIITPTAQTCTSAYTIGYNHFTGGNMTTTYIPRNARLSQISHTSKPQVGTRNIANTFKQFPNQAMGGIRIQAVSGWWAMFRLRQSN
jgi:hypothetical protein